MEYLTWIFMIVTILLILLGFICKKSKVLFGIQILWMWILQALNTGAIDFNINEDIFNVATSEVNILSNQGGIYSLLCYYFRSHGYSYVFMNSILVTIALILIFITIKKYTKNVCFVTSLLFIYPFVDNVIQKRSFLASSIIIFAIPYLFKKSKANIIKFILLCFLAAQIHVSAFIYMLFVMVPFMSYEKMFKNVLKILVLGIVMIPVLPKIASFVFPSSKVELYFSSLKIGVFDMIFWVCFNIGFIFLVCRIKSNKNSDIDYITNIKKIAIFSLIFLPLFYYEPTFIRIYRNLLVFNYIALSQIQMSGRKIYVSVLKSTTLIISYTVFAFIVVYAIAGSGIEKMVFAIFENNLFLRYLFGI